MAISGNLFSSVGGAVSDIFGAVGSFKAASGYGDAAKIADLNAKLAQQSTAIQQKQAARQVFQGLGGQQSDVASAGFSASGSALDLLRSSAQQGALQRQLLAAQGQIDVNSYKQEAISYRAQASASKSSGIGGLVSAGLTIASMFSDEGMKQDITPIGPSHIPGVGLYLFRYKGDATIWKGVLAQEVVAHRPDAVELDDASGFYRVNYEALGLKMEQV